MKLLLKAMYIYCLFNGPFLLFGDSAITNRFRDEGYNLGNSGSGLGDRLIIYFKAKAVAHKFGLPFFLYWPFKYSTNFKFLDFEKEDSKEIEKRFLTIEKFDDKLFQKNKEKDSLYFIGQQYSLKNSDDSGLADFDSLFSYYLQNKKLLFELKKLVNPLRKIKYLSLPKNKICIAVHIRMGKEKDFLQQQKKRPLKFPPLTFYVDQIKKLSNQFGNKDVIFYIFSDVQNSQKLYDRLSKMLKNSYIHLEMNKSDSSEKSLINDLFNLMKFEYLIRPTSSLSRVASILGNHKLIIFPTSCIKVNDEFFIDKVGRFERKKRKISFCENYANF